MIFNGFAEKYSVRILQSLVPALRRGAKVVVNDGPLPDGRARRGEDDADAGTCSCR